MVARSQTLNVHFLGLFPQSSLVLHNCHDNLAVEENAARNWDDVVANVGIKHKADRVPVLRQVVVAAVQKHSL